MHSYTYRSSNCSHRPHMTNTHWQTRHGPQLHAPTIHTHTIRTHTHTHTLSLSHTYTHSVSLSHWPLCCSSALPCVHEYPVQGSKNASTSIKTGCRGHLRRGTAGTKKRRLQGQHSPDFVPRSTTRPRPKSCACSPSVPHAKPTPQSVVGSGKARSKKPLRQRE